MFSILIFVALMVKHRNFTNIKIKYVTNNVELVNRSKEHLIYKYKHPYQNKTLSAEYDKTEQIILTNKTYKIDAIFQHVYGHQNTKPRGAFSMETKPNEVVDKLVGWHQKKLGSYRPISHMYPSTPAVLEINGMTITSNIRNHLIKAYTEPIYIQYLKSKYKWNNDTVKSIARKCLNLCLKGIDRKVVLVKIYNNLLPTTTTTLQK